MKLKGLAKGGKNRQRMRVFSHSQEISYAFVIETPLIFKVVSLSRQSVVGKDNNRHNTDYTLQRASLGIHSDIFGSEFAVYLFLCPFSQLLSLDIST